MPELLQEARRPMLEMLRQDDKRIDVSVIVHLSQKFFGWRFQYVGEMTVISPDYVCEMYAQKMHDGLDDVMGE